ncbi:MAG TPA: pitrilysin family protein, partial [Polyangiaceae bacterium]|nr:pitrilysin family protein [Polyangiaceae bacterium]
MRHPIFVGLLSLILAFARVSNVRAAPPVALPLEEHVLPNGLRVLLAPDPHMVDVSVVVRYAAGARDDPAGHEGLAHLVEHLMFTKSKHVPLRGHFHLLEGAGASDINGMTMEDDTIYRETVPPERLELALWLESDRMGYLLDTLDDDALQHQRTTVLNEYRETRVDTPLSAVPGITQAELFPAGHPYHHDATRLVQAIERTSLDDVRAFVSTWYGPSNAMLTIAGRFDPSQAMTLITRYFATLPPHPPAVRATPPAPGPLMQTYLHVGARVSHDQLRISWITPSYGALGDAELDLAAAVLVRGDASWLHRALIEER